MGSTISLWLNAPTLWKLFCHDCEFIFDDESKSFVYLVPLEVDLGYHLGPPVDSDQGIFVDPEADPRDAPPLQRRAPDVVLELELGVEHLDPAVAGVHHEDPVVHVQGEAAGLDEVVLSGAVAAVTQQRRVMSGHLEKHRTISDGAGKNEHLERRTHVSKSRKRCD